MTATMFFENGTMKHLTVTDIDTVTVDNNTLCIMTQDGGCFYPKILTFE